MVSFLWVCLGGALGSGLRYLLAGWVQRLSNGPFPQGTLTVNLIGSFLLGGLMHVSLTSDLLTPNARLALTTGFLGGFTTYSTFSYETLQLMQEGSLGLAFVNATVTLTTCLAACYFGLVLSRWIVG
jgi:CrcB protein